MKITKLLIFISTISILNLAISTKSINSDQHLAENICRITNDIIKSTNDTQDILIGNLGGIIWSSAVNEIIKCIADETAVVFTDLRIKMINSNLRKAAVIIMAFDKVDGASINEEIVSKLINHHHGSSIYHHMAKIICIIFSTSTQSQRMQALKYFIGFGHLNFALAYKSSSGDVIYEIVKSLPNRGWLFNSPQNFLLIFPDKLKNLNKFKYKVPIFYQPPVIEFTKNPIFTPMLFFLSAVGAAQNAEFDLIFLQNSSDFVTYWHNRQMHLSLNTARVLQYPDPKVQTYDKKSYCALIPFPQTASYFSVIIVKPFDVLIWVFFVLSIVSSVAVWRMYQDCGAVDSHWQLAVGVFTMFIGQGAEFSRHNRFVFAMLLNIISLSVFLLSNLYEGAITSFMIEPARDNRLKTVDDLLNSDYQFQASQLFEYTLKNSSLVQRMSSRLNSSGLQMGTKGTKHVFGQYYVFIRTCDEARITLNHKLLNGQLVSDYYYLLPEELSWQYVQLEASYLNPFVERIQYYMDLCFQAGLPHMWRVMSSQDYSEIICPQSRDERNTWNCRILDQSLEFC
ncbi:unnamed protein product [Chironomus riparius]|uniref:Ionotropic receptor n=1 Tax=Chironomus riparius TaxID=315576 RepID=A0A9N9X0S8_9DIPT|nr:unnamed protein product [Chironomus riparius]